MDKAPSDGQNRRMALIGYPYADIPPRRHGCALPWSGSARAALWTPGSRKQLHPVSSRPRALWVRPRLPAKHGIGGRDCRSGAAALTAQVRQILEELGPLRGTETAACAHWTELSRRVTTNGPCDDDGPICLFRPDPSGR